MLTSTPHRRSRRVVIVAAGVLASMALAPAGVGAAVPAEETGGGPPAPTAGIVQIASSIPPRTLMVDRNGVAWVQEPPDWATSPGAQAIAEITGQDTGDEAKRAAFVPRPVPIPTRVTQVVQANSHWTWLALDDAGAVWVWEYGARRDSATPSRIRGLPPIARLYPFRTLALDVNGTAWTWPDDGAGMPRPRKVRLAKPIEAIWASREFAYARLTDGSVWAWGKTTVDGFSLEVDAGFGDDTTTREYRTPVRIKALDGARAMAFTSGYGVEHRVSFAVMPGGRVVGWGDNQRGLLGRSTPTRFVRRPVTVPGLTRIQSIATDGEAAIALDDSGRAFTWGRFFTNKAGWRTIGARPKVVPGLDPIAGVTLYSSLDTWGCGDTVGGNAFLARMPDGRLFAWAHRKHSAGLGLGSQTFQALTTSPQQVEIGPVSDVVQSEGNCTAAGATEELYVVLQDGTVRGFLNLDGVLAKFPLWH